MREVERKIILFGFAFCAILKTVSSRYGLMQYRTVIWLAGMRRRLISVVVITMHIPVCDQ